MNTKTYLSQARYLDMRIKSKLQQIASLNDLATSCSSVLTGMPRNPNSGGSKMADAVCKMIDLQNELKRDIEALVDLKMDIMNTVRLVADVEQQTLLEKRYLCFLSWEKIAVEMHYSIQHVYRMHDDALKVVDSILTMRVNESE